MTEITEYKTFLLLIRIKFIFSWITLLNLTGKLHSFFSKTQNINKETLMQFICSCKIMFHYIDLLKR